MIFFFFYFSLFPPLGLFLSPLPSLVLKSNMYITFLFSIASLPFSSIPPVLPAARIAVDETRIYWTSNTTEGVHYILKVATPPFNVTTLPSNGTGEILLSTSPGLQQLPGNGSKLWYMSVCLSTAYINQFVGPTVHIPVLC